MFNREGIASVRGRAWCHSAVYRVLQNPLVVGDLVWGKSATGQHFCRGADGPVKRQAPKRNADGKALAVRSSVPPIIHRDVVPAIIKREQFELAQRLLRERGSRKVSPPKTRPLSGLVCCGSCGGGMRFDGNHVRCNHDRAGQYDRCSWRSFKAGPLTETVLDLLHQRLEEPKHSSRLRLAVKRRAEARFSSQGNVASQLREIDARLKALSSEIDRGTRRITLLDDESAAALLAKHVSNLSRDLAGAERERSEIVASNQLGNAGVASLIDAAFAKKEKLRSSLVAAQPVAVNAVLRELGVRITVNATKGQRGQVCVELAAPPATAMLVSPSTPVSTSPACHAR